MSALNSRRPDLIMQNTVKISVFNSFHELKPVWSSFESECDCYAFQSYDWLSNWYRMIGSHQNIEPVLVLVERPSGTPLMILPLGLQRRAFASLLVWLGGDISEYQGPLLCKSFSEIVSADQFSALWKKIVHQLPRHDAICLQRQPESIGGQPNPFVSLACIQHASDAHNASLAENVESFLRQKRGKKWIGTEKRKQRRLEERGRLSFEVAVTPAEIKLFLEAMITQKTESYKKIGVRNILAQAGRVDFLKQLSDYHVRDSFVHLSALKLGDKIVATHWGLVYKKRFYHLLPTYAQNEYARFSPGNILLRNLFDWCMENGIEVYDFTVGDEPYKFLWSDNRLVLFACFKANNLLGLIYIIPVKVVLSLKRYIKQKPLLMKQAFNARMVIARARQFFGEQAGL